MASITKQKDGKYRAFIRKKGLSRSKTFETKREAQTWANKQEVLYEEHGKNVSKQPLSYAVNKYLELVTPHKKTAKNETHRLNRFLNDPICTVALNELKPEHFEAWRDRRLKEVKPSSVNRDWNTINNILTYCVKTWKYLIDNPMSHAKRPKNPPPRSRLPSQDELTRLYHVLGYTPYSTPEKASHWVGACIVFACETAMRAGEIVSLSWNNVSEKSVYIPKTKTDLPRTVPLSQNARKLLASVRSDNDRVFQVTAASLDALYRKYRDKALIQDLHFHDFRHYALTNMASKVDVMTLAKISGHKDLKILMNIYYNPDIEDYADIL